MTWFKKLGRLRKSLLSLTYQTFSCEIAVYADVTVARQAFDAACDIDQPPWPAPAIGDEVCAFGKGVVTLNFRRGETLVRLQADLSGAGVSKMATTIDGRLK